MLSVFVQVDVKHISDLEGYGLVTQDAVSMIVHPS
jgi:hypothetical protein